MQLPDATGMPGGAGSAGRSAKQIFAAGVTAPRWNGQAAPEGPAVLRAAVTETWAYKGGGGPGPTCGHFVPRYVEVIR